LERTRAADGGVTTGGTACRRPKNFPKKFRDADTASVPKIQSRNGGIRSGFSPLENLVSPRREDKRLICENKQLLIA
jgi:hypothetical protein